MKAVLSIKMSCSMIVKTEKFLLTNRFRIAKRSPKHPQVDDREKAGVYIQLGIISVLIVLIALVLTFNEKKEFVAAPYVPLDYVLTVEQIPETRYSNMPPPPPKMPAIPVESEEIVEILEDVVYEMESIGFVDLPEMPGVPGGLPGVSESPRPTVEKWFEYPESEKKKGHEGIIDLKILVDTKGDVAKVEVLRNTTGSKVLEEIAREAALECKYQPGRDGKNRPIAVWTSKTISFNISENTITNKFIIRTGKIRN